MKSELSAIATYTDTGGVLPLSAFRMSLRYAGILAFGGVKNHAYITHMSRPQHNFTGK